MRKFQCNHVTHDARLSDGTPLSFEERAAIVKANPPVRCNADAVVEIVLYSNEEEEDTVGETFYACAVHAPPQRG